MPFLVIDECEIDAESTQDRGEKLWCMLDMDI